MPAPDPPPAQVAGFFLHGRIEGVGALFGMLVFGFWLPPLLVGRFLGRRYSPAWISLLTAVLWPLLWLVIILSLIPPYSPGDSPDASGMLAASAIMFTSVVSLVSATACWLGALHFTWQRPLNPKMVMGISLTAFAIIQALLIGSLFLR